LRRGKSINTRDGDGKTAVHHVVNPLEFGSYENDLFLRLLASVGADLNIKDNAGHAPLYYAFLQESGKMARTLLELGAVDEFAATQRPVRASSIITDWSELLPDVDSDAQEYITAATARVAQKQSLGAKHVVDRNSYLAKTGVVYVDAAGVAYDIVMTKVDSKYGQYGQNHFYKMQLIYQASKNLYVMFTRWGRIGESGQYQHTPFGTVDEAVLEFGKLFRTKTGNAWANHPVHAHFERKPKKWNLVHIDFAKVDVNRLLQPFDWDSYPKSRLPENVQAFFKVITDVKFLQTTMRSSGIDTELLPLGNLSAETIEKARGILQQAKEALETIKEMSKAIAVGTSHTLSLTIAVHIAHSLTHSLT